MKLFGLPFRPINGSLDFDKKKMEVPDGSDRDAWEDYE